MEVVENDEKLKNKPAEKRKGKRRIQRHSEKLFSSKGRNKQMKITKEKKKTFPKEKSGQLLRMFCRTALKEKIK